MDPNPTNPEPPGPKKGLHPVAWLGIGCAGLVVVGILVFSLASAFLFNRAAEFLKDVEEDPERAAAKIYVALNPDLEMLQADDEAGTLTFRVIETGEEVTLRYNQIAAEGFEYETAAGKTTFRTGENAPLVSVQSRDGSLEIGGATIDPDKLPEWVRPMVYPDIAAVQSVMASTTAGEVSGTLVFSTADPPDEVSSFYNAAFEAAGFIVEESVSPDLQNIGLTAEGPKKFASAQTMRSADGAHVVFTYREEPAE